jgi:hypothetical protein
MGFVGSGRVGDSVGFVGFAMGVAGFASGTRGFATGVEGLAMGASSPRMGVEGFAPGLSGRTIGDCVGDLGDAPGETFGEALGAIVGALGRALGCGRAFGEADGRPEGDAEGAPFGGDFSSCPAERVVARQSAAASAVMLAPRPETAPSRGEVCRTEAESRAGADSGARMADPHLEGVRRRVRKERGLGCPIPDGHAKFALIRSSPLEPAPEPVSRHLPNQPRKSGLVHQPREPARGTSPGSPTTGSAAGDRLHAAVIVRKIRSEIGVARGFGHPVRMRSICLSVVGAFLGLGILPVSAHADYATDAAAPLAIRATGTDDVQPKAVPAPDGGSYVSYFSGTGYDVRLARLDANGAFVWKSTDILVEDRTNSSTTDYGLASDADGNAYLAYEVGSAIICSAIAPDGSIRWRKTVSFAAGGSVGRVTVASDGFIWVAFIEGSSTRVQRLDASGNASFATGVLLNETSASMFCADLKPSENGAIIVSCVRYTTFSGPKILRAHRVNSDGTKPWASIGTSVFTTGSLQFGNFPAFIADGAGGAYFTWYSTVPLQCFAQRVNAAGAVQYGTNGVAVTTTSTTERVSPSMVLGADGRLYVFWSQHTPNSSIYGIFGQCFAGGVRQWGDNGAAVAPLATTYSRTWATAATLNGGIACFYDDSPSATQDNIRCGILTAKGTVASTVDVAVNSGVKYRLAAAAAPADGSLLFWQGGASTGASDVYGARMNADGTLGPAPSSNPADLNGDGMIDAADLSLLLSNWGGSGVGDIDGDGSVGAADLSALLAAWMA